MNSHSLKIVKCRDQAHYLRLCDEPNVKTLACFAIPAIGDGKPLLSLASDKCGKKEQLKCDSASSEEMDTESVIPIKRAKHAVNRSTYTKPVNKRISKLSLTRRKPLMECNAEPLHLKHQSDPNYSDSDSELSDDFTPASKKQRQDENHDRKAENVTTEPGSITDAAAKEILIDILPAQYEYKIMAIHDKELVEGRVCFTTVLRCDIQSKEAALQWIDDFKESSHITLCCKRTYPERTRCITFKRSFRCHHNTRASFPSSKTKNPHYKHTQCKATVIITVKNVKMKRSNDPELRKYCCEIFINHRHNHHINAADAVRFRKPSPSVVALMSDLFRKGHSPHSALQIIKFGLQEEHGSLFFKALADGSKCPNLLGCYRLYYKIFEKDYGAKEGQEMMECMKAFILKYNEECGSECAKIFQDSDNYIVALCAPLMKRVVSFLRSSGEMTFMDAGGNMDRQNSRVLLLLAPSVVGGLPIGVIITSSESTPCIAKGLEMLKSLWPENAFFGKGINVGPSVFMTDDSDAERGALRLHFPEAHLLLCKFHVLQVYWRFLWDSKKKIDKSHRPQLFFLFRAVVNASSIDEFNSLYDELLQNATVTKYSCLVDYLQTKRSTSVDWALAFRQGILTRGHDTNNISEANIRVVKEGDVLGRLKAFNVVQLFDFITTKFIWHYEKRITDVLSNRLPCYTKSRYFIHPDKLKPLSVMKMTDTVYEVRNRESGGTYLVNTEIDLCTCPVGKNGAPCKHQYAVSLKFKITSTQFLPLNDEQAKMSLHKILTGTVADVPKDWYASLRDPASSSTTIQSEDQGGTSSLEVIQTEDTLFPEAGDESSSAAVSDNDTKELFENIDDLSEKLKNRFRSRPEVFGPALKKFFANFNRVDKLSENALSSALHTFGKVVGSSAIKRGRAMPVQPTTPSRRTVYMGGRKVQHQGRPTKAMVQSLKTAEHGYVASSKPKKNKSSWAVFPSKKFAAPHSLSHCVSQNTALGKGHSKK